MTIYIKNSEEQFVPANDIDLECRGYSPTQELGSIPQIEDGEVKLTVTDFTRDQKVKIIKVIRKVCIDHYGKETFVLDSQTTFKITPPTQESDYDDNAFGLKHMKHFVEGICTLTIHKACFTKIVRDLETEREQAVSPLECTFEETYPKGSNNLERLQDHRALLKEELRKIDDLIAYQLYS